MALIDDVNNLVAALARVRKRDRDTKETVKIAIDAGRMAQVLNSTRLQNHPMRKSFYLCWRQAFRNKGVLTIEYNTSKRGRKYGIVAGSKGSADWEALRNEYAFKSAPGYIMPPINFPRDIRHHIFAGKTEDWDLRSAHQGIIGAAAERLGAPTSDLAVLRDFMQRKEAYFAEVLAAAPGCTIDDAKRLFLAAHNKLSWINWVAKLNEAVINSVDKSVVRPGLGLSDCTQPECHKAYYASINKLVKFIHDNMDAAEREAIREECDPNRRKPHHIVSRYLQDTERCIVEPAMRLAEEVDGAVSLYEYDGFHAVYPSKVGQDQLDILLADLSERECLDMPLSKWLQWTKKEMHVNEEWSALSTEYAETPEDHIVEGDLSAAKLLLAHAPYLVQVPDLRHFTRVNHCWLTDKDLARKELTKTLIGLDPVKESENGFIRLVESYSRKNAIVDYALQVTEPDEEFLDKLRCSSRGKLCYKDGVYDFATKTLTPWESCDVITPVTTKIMFPARPSEEITKEVRKVVFEDVVGAERVDQVLAGLSRTMAGHVTDKQWMLVLGERNCGKSTLEEALRAAFGNDYVVTIASDNFIMKGKQGEAARARQWLRPCEFARAAVTSEVSFDPDIKGLKVDGKDIKSMMSGGDQQNSREVYEKASTFYVGAGLIMLANDMPPVQPADALQTAAVIRCPHKFENPAKFAQMVADGEITEDDPMYRKGMTDLKDVYLQRPDVIAAVSWLIFDAYKETPVVYTGVIAEDSLALRVEQGDDLAWFRKHFKFTRKDTDLIAVRRMNAIRTNDRYKLKITKTKFEGRLEAMGAKRTTQRVFIDDQQTHAWMGVRFVEPEDEE